MARRKRQWLDDDDSSEASGDGSDDFDEGGDPNERAERELLNDPYQTKRRRRGGGGKERAIYGVFGEDEDQTRGPRAGSSKGGRLADLAKAPTFVGGKKTQLETDTKMKGDDEDEDNEEDDDDEDSEDDSEQEPEVEDSRRESAMEEDEPESRPAIGLGAHKRAPVQPNSPPASSTTPSAPPTRAGIGASSRGGIGSSTPAGFSSGGHSTLPTSFGSANAAGIGSSRTQRSFLRGGVGGIGSGSGTSTPNLSETEQRHFANISGSFGAKMMEKMGWKVGTGLGAEGKGIVTPVESKLRPKGAGIAYKGFKEKTEQSRAEARRRGEVVSDDEEPQRGKGKGKARQGKGKENVDRSDAWKKPKKSKTKVKHMTYEQIVQEAGQDIPAGVGIIIDATGAKPREVSSLADLPTESWTPSTDTTRLPEVRHNLRLLVDMAKGDLDGLAREGKALEERKKWVRDEDTRLRKLISEEAELIARLQQVHIVVESINTQAKASASLYEATLQPFAPYFDKLLSEYSKEFDMYRLDEVLVAAIAPLVRRLVAQWKPLEDPNGIADQMRHWKQGLKMSSVDNNPAQLSVYGNIQGKPALQQEVVMTPYESLLWNIWLPRVRSTINNDWSPEDADPIVSLLTAWKDLLPQFIYDNILDQLVIPKLQSAITDRNPKKSRVSLQSLVFPWLPHLGPRSDILIDDASRRFRSLLRHWTVSEGVPKNLIKWKDVFAPASWENMLLKYILPKLGSTLRDDFKINPRNQNMEPFQCVLAWSGLFRASVFSQLLETEFIPKWLGILRIWLVQPNPNFDEVAQWYSSWKQAFPADVLALPSVQEGFTRGLKLMDKAIELGPDAPTHLPHPDLLKTTADGSSKNGPQQSNAKRTTARAPIEITFRSIVEEFASSHNLFFVPSGKVHEKSRMPLFRVSPNVDGKGGLSVYISDDAVWAQDGESYRAVTLEDMVLRANKTKR